MKAYPFDPKILARFFEGTLPEEQHLEVLNWVSTLPEAEQVTFMDSHLAALKDFQPAKTELTAEKTIIIPSAGFEQIAARILEKEQTKPKSINLILKIAAVTLPFLLIWFFSRPTFTEPSLHIAQHKTAPARFIQVSNALNQIHTVQLPDSSTASLYPGASINYPAGFNSKKREIQLKGKAFFKVKHEQTRPFTVQTGTITTVVLGTSFWVDATSTAGTVSVKVKTGKVGVVHANQQTVFLLPAEKAVFNSVSGSLVSVKRALPKTSHPAIAAMPTAIAFNETPLKQVIKVLAENFKVQIISADSVNTAAPVNLNTRGKTITAILEEIKSQIPIVYEIKGSSILIRNQEKQP